MSRPRHNQVHDPCPNGATSWGACGLATRIAIGQCVSMLDEDRQCDHWGVDRVEGKAYCGQHINSVYLAADKARRDAEQAAEIAARVDAFMAWTALHPSVWDRMPIGWTP